MVLKKKLCKGVRVKISKVRIKKNRLKGVRRVETVHNGKKVTVEIKPYSFSEMIMDEQKRLATYKYYDDNYKESDEEREIFKAMRRRRM